MGEDLSCYLGNRATEYTKLLGDPVCPFNAVQFYNPDSEHVNTFVNNLEQRGQAGVQRVGLSLP